MRVLTLYRAVDYPIEGTLGLLVDEDGYKICYTLENEWCNNQVGMSRIPPGNYEVEWLEKSAGGYFTDIYWIKGVQDRTGILIHTGNTENDTSGCLLPGTEFGKVSNKDAVLNSKAALSKIHMVVNRGPFILRVRDTFLDLEEYF